MRCALRSTRMQQRRKRSKTNQPNQQQSPSSKRRSQVTKQVQRTRSPVLDQNQKTTSGACAAANAYFFWMLEWLSHRHCPAHPNVRKPAPLAHRTVQSPKRRMPLHPPLPKLSHTLLARPQLVQPAPPMPPRNVLLNRRELLLAPLLPLCVEGRNWSRCCGSAHEQLG